MGFRLRYLNHDFELSDGEFVVGRSGECQLAVDDPLVSRRHASITAARGLLTVQDLGSRNGVKVNGELIDGVCPLALGDLITIGSQEITVMGGRASAEPRPPAETQRRDAFGMLGALTEKALALGHADEAERLLGSHLARVLEAAGQGTVAFDLADKAARWALRLAAATGKGSWFDFVIRICAAQQRVAPADIVDELHVVVRKVDSVNLEVLRSYVEDLRDRTGMLGPTERFTLGRIEGLERVASSR